MKRDFLKELGLEENVVEKIFAEHGKTVQLEKDKYTTLEEDNKNLKADLKERDGQLETLQKETVGNEELQKQITKLQEDNKKKETEYETKLSKQAIEHALSDELTKAKVKNKKAVKALLDEEIIKLDGNKLIGLEEQLKNIKDSDSYLFEEEAPKEQQKPAFGSGNYSQGSNKNLDPFEAKLAKYK
jgi:hypothetical protein